MQKIDVHTHILPPELPKFKEKFGYGGFVMLDHHAPCKAKMMKDTGEFFREIESNCWDPVVRMQECEPFDVRVQVLSTVPVMFSYWAKPNDCLELSKFLNDHIAQVVSAHPKRFVGLGTVPMQDPKLAVKELKRCIGELKLAGIQIGSHVNDYNLNDENLFPIFEAAEALGAAIFVHPWDMMGQERMKKYWLPWLVGMPAETSLAICSMIFGGVLERLPRLRVCFAHGGGSFPATVGRIQHGFDCRPDLCAVDNNVSPRAYLGKFYVDSLVHDEKALRFILDILGADRVTLGTDYPFPLGELEPGRLIESLQHSLPALDDKTLRGLLVDNALDWLGKTAQELDLNPAHASASGL